MQNIKNFDLEKVEYIDNHCHLHDKVFDQDRLEILQKLQAEKIAIISIGTDLAESQKAKDLATTNSLNSLNNLENNSTEDLLNKNIFYTAGLHPHDNLQEFNLALEQPDLYFQKLKILAQHEKCVAIGETGLDYFYAKEDLEFRKQQKIILEKHLDLAKELNLPIMLHIRPSENKNSEGKINREDAYLDAIEILQNYQEKYQMKLSGNFHFFVSTLNILEKILQDLPGFTVSIPAVCTFTTEYDEMIKKIPLNKIHLETDSPYVLPKSRRKDFKRNQPNFVIDVFQKICEIKNFNTVTEKNNFQNILRENFRNLYFDFDQK